ncbi:hypothetical protein FN846DRAFT_901769 [Sphaerosporella brunnea]|uniref:Uncharacterized protein n=1 Tax=Sphaerosporella brunnea TaxID=1250544 RepID=A0A5J5FAS8_9PEZI|nr:hypothetical protein FN846DRAFT_901769 [Sphaerosporella brunnea]
MSPISNLPAELYLDIMAALLHASDYDIGIALRRNLLPFLHASPCAFRVWRENKASILNRVAAAHLARLKPYALTTHRKHFRSLLRWYVRLATFKLAPSLQDPSEEMDHALLLDERMLEAATESAAAERRLKGVRQLVGELKAWMAVAYDPLEIGWTNEI